MTPYQSFHTTLQTPLAEKDRLVVLHFEAVHILDPVPRIGQPINPSLLISSHSRPCSSTCSSPSSRSPPTEHVQNAHDPCPIFSPCNHCGTAALEQQIDPSVNNPSAQRSGVWTHSDVLNNGNLNTSSSDGTTYVFHDPTSLAGRRWAAGRHNDGGRGCIEFSGTCTVY